jgi:hypothetical protein
MVAVEKNVVRFILFLIESENQFSKILGCRTSLVGFRTGLFANSATKPENGKSRVETFGEIGAKSPKLESQLRELRQIPPLSGRNH